MPGWKVPSWLTPKRVIALVAAVMVGIAGVWTVRVVSNLSSIFHSNPLSVVKSAIGLGGDSAVDKQRRNLQRINIALYGYGGPGHDGPYLTDSIMVVSIQPLADGSVKVAEIGIPRDWEVPIDLGQGQTAQNRINTAYSSGMIDAPYKAYVDKSDHMGGGRVADATLERMLGIHIDYFIGVDFDAFKQAVDSVGGIDVDVPHTFTDHHYPSDNCDSNKGPCVDTTIHFDQGRHHMDGQTALRFARSRESDDPVEQGNFARNKRQQIVLNAIKQKVLSIGGISNLPNLLSALGDHVITDMPFDSAKSLYELTKGVDTSKITRVSIDDTNFIHECSNCSAAVEYPYDRTFASVQHFIKNVIVSPDALQNPVPVSVVDASGTGVGADRRWASLLTEIGFPATDSGTQRRSPTTHVIDHSGGSASKEAKWLADYFGVSVETGSGGGTSAASGGSSTSSGSGITLVLGQDEEATFNTTDRGLYRN